jgi:hypothetical protein
MPNLKSCTTFSSIPYFAIFSKGDAEALFTREEPIAARRPVLIICRRDKEVLMKNFYMGN